MMKGFRSEIPLAQWVIFKAEEMLNFQYSILNAQVDDFVVNYQIYNVDWIQVGEAIIWRAVFKAEGSTE